MYNDAQTRGRSGSATQQSQAQPRYGQDIVYGEPVAFPRTKGTSSSRADFGRFVTRDNDDDDKDVRELKSLLKSKKSARPLDINDISEDEYGNNGILDDILGELYYKDDLSEDDHANKASISTERNIFVEVLKRNTVCVRESKERYGVRHAKKIKK